jgi:hypothetical protein
MLLLALLRRAVALIREEVSVLVGLLERGKRAVAAHEPDAGLDMGLAAVIEPVAAVLVRDQPR